MIALTSFHLGLRVFFCTLLLWTRAPLRVKWQYGSLLPLRSADLRPLPSSRSTLRIPVSEEYNRAGGELISATLAHRLKTISLTVDGLAHFQLDGDRNIFGGDGDLASVAAILVVQRKGGGLVLCAHIIVVVVIEHRSLADSDVSISLTRHSSKNSFKLVLKMAWTSSRLSLSA